ncbi:MAG TPA: aldo/keto reductase [Candidatus Binatia bacterium]
MKLNRREFLKAGVGAGASLLLPSGRVFAQSGGLIQRKIPSSGESLPVIGIGTAQRYASAPTQAELGPLRETVRRFAQLGGKVVDTAQSYGEAEPIVGKLVEELKIRDSLFIATKQRARGREQGIEQMEVSFRNLRSSKIDLFAVHNLRDMPMQLAVLREAKNAGGIRYLGITTSQDRQYEDFEAVMKAEKLDFIQVDYALDNRESDRRILPLAADRGMAVMINLPLGRGRLFRAVQGRALLSWATEFDCASWAQFFLKYIVSHPAVTCAVPGMAKVKYVEDNIGAARGRLPDAAMRRRMEQFIEAL